jgi:hypothetical protein
VLDQAAWGIYYTPNSIQLNYNNRFSVPDTTTFFISIFPKTMSMDGSPFFRPIFPNPGSVEIRLLKSPAFELQKKILK